MIRVIPDLRNMYDVCWDDSFKKYIKESKDPMPWFYRFIRKRGNVINWDNNYIDSVFVRASDYKELIQDLTDSQISQEVKQDLMGLLAKTNGTTLSEDAHPFIADAMAWHRKNAPKNKQQK